MKKTLACAALVVAASATASAADLIDTAQVVSSTPIIERVTEPRQECAPVAAAPQEHSIAGPIVGGVAGAILGNQVGRGNGRTAATAAGAVVGTIVGDRVGNAPAAPAQQCRTIQTTREVVKGYTVVYRYYDRDITTTLPYNPGSTVRVGVSVVDNAPVASAPAPTMARARGRGAHPAPVYEAAPTAVGAPGGY
jgi:uncharacterized protein YcfJ